MTLTVHIITPEKSLPPVQADHVTLPGSEGELGIRTGHAPIVSLLKPGVLDLKSQSKADTHYVIDSGVAQVFKDEVMVLTRHLGDPSAVREADLIKRLHALDEATYEDAIDLAKAKAEAHWLGAQLKSAGKDVPALKQVG